MSREDYNLGLEKAARLCDVVSCTCRPRNPKDHYIECAKSLAIQIRQEKEQSEYCWRCGKLIMKPDVNYGIRPDEVCKCPVPTEER